MEVVSQVNRRKACDLCFKKKIRCDMLKPVCSNCLLYKVDCRTTAVRRRIVPPKVHHATSPASSHSSSTGDAPNQGESRNRIDQVEARLARIEEQLQQVLAVATAALNNNGRATEVADAPQKNRASLEDSTRPTTRISSTEVRAFRSQQPAMTSRLELRPTPDQDEKVPNPHRLSLPPLDEILPAIEDFFDYVNVHVPLFSRDSFMRMLDGWYTMTTPNHRAEWAAINIVLAMASRLPPGPRNGLGKEVDDAKVADYLANAQSMLSELVTRDQDILGLQVLLGLVLLFKGTRDPRPASVLIGTAVRLAHRLQLHSRDSQARFPPAEALQRTRLFWIGYYLDKDISLRHHTPAVQTDADIDQDLPSENPPDGIGNIYSKDGRIRVNFFLLRLQLSHVQGRVYELLYSTRSAKISAQERQARVENLEDQLELWKLNIPCEMLANQAVENVDRIPLVWLTSMHFAYLGCLAMIHGIWSHNANWLKRISGYSSVAVSDGLQLAASAYGIPQQPPLPKGWKRCVEASRACLGMVYRVPLNDCNMWQTGCPYVSGILILLVNMYELPAHEFVEHDKELVRYSLSVFDKMSENTALLQMKRLRTVISELDRLATQAIERAKETPIPAGWEQPLEGTRSLDHLPVTFVIGESWADCVGAPPFFPDEPSPASIGLGSPFSPFFADTSVMDPYIG